MRGQHPMLAEYLRMAMKRVPWRDLKDHSLWMTMETSRNDLNIITRSPPIAWMSHPPGVRETKSKSAVDSDILSYTFALIT